MGDTHEYLCRQVRASYAKGGFKEAKSPMPTYRPDFFAQKFSANGHIHAELVIEVEIEQTIFLTHSQDQLVLMDEFLTHRRRKKSKACGLLVVPHDPKIIRRAKSLLNSLFPSGTFIQVKSFN